MTTRRIQALLVFCLSFAAAGAARYFPQVADGTAAGITLQSTIVLVNAGEPTSARLSFFDSTGTPWTPDLGVASTAEGTFDLQLPAGGAVRLTTPGDPDSIAVGYAVLEAPETVDGTVVFSGKDAATGVSLFEAGVPATSPVQRFTIFVDTRGDLNTGLAVVNPGTQAAELTYRLRDKNHRLLAERSDAAVHLAAGGHQARYVTELFRPGDFAEGVDPNTVREMEGTLEVTCANTLVAPVTLRQFVSTETFPVIVPVLTTLPVVPAVTGEAPSGWRLVWADEFDGTTVDTNRWEFMIGDGTNYGIPGWGNAELEYYTDRPENARVEGGSLHIVARKESFGGRQYTSARLRTKNKGDWTYGRFEIRAKLPKGKGIWPALWMLPTDEVYGGWPHSGEIDIMELVGHEPNRVHGTLHYSSQTGSHVFTGMSYRLPSGDFSDDFHVFALEWEPGEMRWYVDGKLFLVQTYWSTRAAPYPAPFDQRFHLLMNLAVGGNWPGSPDATTVFPQEMVIDYVRVYEKVE
ncbi:MAG: hypothetical protein Kow00109_30080 [Acidobacteriota bacterium]